MSVLRVQGSELHRLARGLDSSANRLRGVSRSLASAGSGGLGSADLDEACGEFAESWEYGVGKLGELAGGASEFLRKTVQTFGDVDQQLGQALRSGGKQ